MKTVLAVLLLVTALSVPHAAAEIYKWKDRDGVLHFGDTPPPMEDEANVVSIPSSEDKPAATKDTAPAPPESPLPANGKAHDEGAPEPATSIHVSISEDGFLPDRSTSGHWKTASQLTEVRPEYINTEPEYKGTRPLYGSMKMGTRENKLFYFAFDLVDEPNPLLYFDKNQNGDLTDDGGPLTNQGTGIFATTITIPFSQLIKEVDLPGDLDSWFFTNDGMWKKRRVTHYNRTRLKGTVTIDYLTYTAYLVDRDDNDADFTNDGICIDLNRDGEIDSKEETFLPGRVATIEDKNYKFVISW